MQLFNLILKFANKLTPKTDEENLANFNEIDWGDELSQGVEMGFRG